MEIVCSTCQTKLPKEAQFCYICGTSTQKNGSSVFSNATVNGDIVANKFYLKTEEYHWKEALATGFSLFLGLSLIVTSFQNNNTLYESIGLIFSGLLIIGLSIASFQVTEGWKLANDLPTGKKIIAYFPVLTTGVALLGILILLLMIKNAISELVEQKTNL